ncbi:MAG: CatB-related O-acetyltransferase [Ferruginibacter sp.]
MHKTTAVQFGTRLHWSEVGKYTYIGNNSYVIHAKLGSFCSIANNVMIGSARHPLKFVSSSPVFYKKDNLLKKCFAEIDFREYEDTLIGSDVWIGANAFIKAGVTIGHGAVIGAHSIVTKNVDPYAIVVGNPAKEIKKRFDDATINKLLQSKWWDYSDELLQEKAADFADVPAFLKSQSLA